MKHNIRKHVLELLGLIEKELDEIRFFIENED